MGLFLYKSINDPSGSFSRVTITRDATCRDLSACASLVEGQLEKLSREFNSKSREREKNVGV